MYKARDFEAQPHSRCWHLCSWIFASEFCTSTKMFFSKLGLVSACALVACWAAANATPTALRTSGNGLSVRAVNGNEGETAAENRFFILTISPEDCTSSAGRLGTCRSASDCNRKGHTAEGTCAWLNLGVCCVGGTAPPATTELKCNSATSALQATFVNPSSPNTDSGIGSCVTTITAGSNICQLRLDMTEFTLKQPNDNGVCDTSYFTVTGGSSNVPQICGENAGQHMYVDVTSGDEVELDVVSGSVGEKWNIKVTQIPCNSADRAPSGCLQYFTDTSGTISSFNYGGTGDETTRQLANQMYGICVKPQSGYCSVTYTQASGSAFSLSGDPGAQSPALPSTPLVGSTDCPTDYLLIPGSTIVDNTNFPAPQPTSADRYCGAAFPGAMTSNSPYTINFVSDGAELNTGGDSDIGNKGFQLSYTLDPC